MHGPENYVHAVENHTDRGEKCSNQQHSGTGALLCAGKQCQRNKAAKEDLDGEEDTQSARKCVGELAVWNGSFMGRRNNVCEAGNIRKVVPKNIRVGERRES